MNFNLYINTRSWSKATDFNTKFWYKSGKCVAKQVGDVFTSYDTAFSSPESCFGLPSEVERDDDAYKAAKHAFHLEQLKLEQCFKRDLFAYFGVSDNPKAEQLFTLVSGMHSVNGHEDIFNVFDTLVELIKD